MSVSRGEKRKLRRPSPGFSGRDIPVSHARQRLFFRIHNAENEAVRFNRFEDLGRLQYGSGIPHATGYWSCAGVGTGNCPAPGGL